MQGLKSLVFKTNSIDLSSEQVARAFIIKVFHLYQTRNEWTNWSGDTSVVKRTWSLFYMNLEDATDSSEAQRTQGTKFVIDELPALCVIGKRYALIAAELFTENPLKICDILDNHPMLTLKYVESKINCGQWFVSAIYTGPHENLYPVSNGERFFSRVSQSTGGKSYLAWKLNSRNIDLEKLNKWVRRIDGLE
ncbi:MAG: hypothetical protein PHR94_11040 [Methylomonas lenta]|nr:hypothetical protein [Methylomonas lenta]